MKYVLKKPSDAKPAAETEPTEVLAKHLLRKLSPGQSLCCRYACSVCAKETFHQDSPISPIPRLKENYNVPVMKNTVIKYKLWKHWYRY